MIATGFAVDDEIRVDGAEKVSGRAKYSADLKQPGMLWAAFVTSPFARARIESIDATVARSSPGVRAVLTGADIGPKRFGLMLADWPVLAVDCVRFIGEYVVAVAAESRELAETAAASIDVRYTELPPTLDTLASMAVDAPLIHEDDSDYLYVAGVRPTRRHPNIQGSEIVRKGDPEAALARAAHVFEGTFRTPRYHAGYIEPRATLVWISNGVVHVACTNQSPFLVRDVLARTTGLEPDRIVVEQAYVGGSFGAKSLTTDEFPLYYLARATKRPVKHVRTHAQDVRSSGIRHAATVRARIGMSEDGIIVAIDLSAVFDGGAYAAAKVLPHLVPGRCPRIPYAVDDLQVERLAVYTNTVPATFVRAPSDVQIFFALESVVDIAAAELKIDPLELRLRNAAVAGATDVEGNPIARPRVRTVLERLRQLSNWDGPLPSSHARGMALTGREMAYGTTSLTIAESADGTVTVDTGVRELGVGVLTVIQRVLARELNIDPAHVMIRRRATSDVPRDAGVGGSRSTALYGNAALDAVKKLRSRRAAGECGEIQVVGEAAHLHRPGEPGWLNFAAYCVELSVDAETGVVTLHDVSFVADVGTIINPVSHQGQIDGGFLMGLGVATTEELVLEEGSITNAALSEYKLPSQRDMPPLRAVCLEPDGGPGPFGARAAGEFNIAGVAPAIANALAAASGARLFQLPLTAPRIYDALLALRRSDGIEGRRV